MTKNEFMNKLDLLLLEYCISNPDYQNLHEAMIISEMTTPYIEKGVRVSINTYLYCKEKRV